MPLDHPQTIAELAETIVKCSSLGRPIYSNGNDTCFGNGSPLANGLTIDIRALSQVIDYPARDMTITVQAGITIAKLTEILAAENQRLPIDVPFPDKATLGCAIATNTSGPRRYGFGTFRDYVIGITTINDEGQETKAGGRVVKNVAGYDLCKLHIGALGTLGISSQVTLKVKPIPEYQAFVIFSCQDGVLADLLDSLHQSRTQPVCIDVINSRMAERIERHVNLSLTTDPWVIFVGFEHNREAVDWQVDQFLKELTTHASGNPIVVRGSEANPIWMALTNGMADTDAAVVFKANMVPSASAEYCNWQNSQPIKPRIQAHAGNGIVIGQIDSEQEPAKQFIKEALSKAQDHHGNLVILKCPSAWRQNLPIWGAPRGDTWLMQAIKNKLDPRGLFNPGCFVDGI